MKSFKQPIPLRPRIITESKQTWRKSFKPAAYMYRVRYVSRFPNMWVNSTLLLAAFGITYKAPGSYPISFASQWLIVSWTARVRHCSLAITDLILYIWREPGWEPVYVLKCIRTGLLSASSNTAMNYVPQGLYSVKNYSYFFRTLLKGVHGFKLWYKGLAAYPIMKLFGC